MQLPPTLQLTAFAAPVTVAENCSDVPVFNCKLPGGKMLTLTPPPLAGETVIVAEPVLEESLMEVAVTVTLKGAETVAGAV